MTSIDVIKLDINGQEVVRYTGQVLQQDREHILLEAFFSRKDTPVDEIVLAKGDRFLETFYTNRWYNIFEVHGKNDDHLKGWYCNVGYPADISDGSVSYVDLALDLLVYPNGRQVVLDEDEFAGLPISPEIRQQALKALEELKQRFHHYDR